jgi:hypothetical protein
MCKSRIISFIGRTSNYFCYIGAGNVILYKWRIRKCLFDMKHGSTIIAFWDDNNKEWRKWCEFVSPFFFNNTYGLLVLTKGNKCPNQVFYFWLIILHTICAKYGLETWFPPNDDIRKYLLDMKQWWSKNPFWDVNNKRRCKWCTIDSPFLFINTYGLPVLTMDTKCPNQVFYDWLVLNRGWKRVSLQIIAFIYICSTWSLVELKTRFEMCITRKDVNGVN